MITKPLCWFQAGHDLSIIHVQTPSITVRSVNASDKPKILTGSTCYQTPDIQVNGRGYFINKSVCGS